MFIKLCEEDASKETAILTCPSEESDCSLSSLGFYGGLWTAILLDPILHNTEPILRLAPSSPLGCGFRHEKVGVPSMTIARQSSKLIAARPLILLFKSNETHLLRRKGTMIECKIGVVLADDIEALMKTVNFVTTAGCDIALQFEKAFPNNFGDYEQAYEHHDI